MGESTALLDDLFSLVFGEDRDGIVHPRVLVFGAKQLTRLLNAYSENVPTSSQVRKSPLMIVNWRRRREGSHTVEHEASCGALRTPNLDRAC